MPRLSTGYWGWTLIRAGTSIVARTIPLPHVSQNDTNAARRSMRAVAFATAGNKFSRIIVPVAAHAASGIEWLLKLSPLKAYERLRRQLRARMRARKGCDGRALPALPVAGSLISHGQNAQSCPPGLRTHMIAETKTRATLGSLQNQVSTAESRTATGAMRFANGYY